jgi:hypothetical protein
VLRTFRLWVCDARKKKKKRDEVVRSGEIKLFTFVLLEHENRGEQKSLSQ